ncbi:hypothetical protein VMCG_05629 [Cytospora schulzeri]|uniref:Protein kinase domain-containing protein n=1 Tax=Cytospora schulzeri TaxID=448051 RepID=A0A423WFA9_9PEZI|nr:hypothetical protein VMCG_05629 [Valsa malicola]
MADDGVEAVVECVPLAYLTPENQAAQKTLTLLGDRNANLPNLAQNNPQLPRSNHYLFEFNAENEAAFSLARVDYMREYIYSNTSGVDVSNPQLPCHLLDALPKPTHVRIGDIIIHQTISQGAFGLVRRNVESVMNEIDLATQLPASTVGVLPLLCTWCEHGDSPPCYSGKLEEVHLLMPYAPYDFHNAPWKDIPLATRLSLFRQVLEGLSNLHSAGIMHRDISPRNSLILSLGPEPRAAICDFGKSKRGATGLSTSLGPPSFVAPEVWRREGYTNAIDVFSLGLTMLYTFQQNWRETGPMDKEGGYKTVLKRLASLREQGHIPGDLGALLRSMLSWDPVDRLSAAQALEHRAWHGVPDSTGQQGSDVSPRGEATAGTRAESGTGTGTGTGGGSGGEKRARRSDGPSLDSVAPGGSRSGTAAGSGAGRAKRVRRSDGPSPDTPPASSGEEEDEE